MSLLVALTAKRPLEAAIILSGYLPLRQYIENVGNRDLLSLRGALANVACHRLQLAASAPRDTPIFWGHGADDPFLT